MTRAHPIKPVRRVVRGFHGSYVAEIRADVLTLRPLRSRSGGPAEIVVTWERVYTKTYAPPSRRTRRRA